MSEQNQDERDREKPSRRAYEAPAVVESAAFETLALACGKVDTTAECIVMPTNS